MNGGGNGRVLTLAEPLVTDRLLLRSYAPDDLAVLHLMQVDPEVARYIPWTMTSREQSKAWLDERIRHDRLAGEGDGIAWAVVRRSDDTLLGGVSLGWRSVEHAHAEVGFVFARQHHGRGYAREATAAVLTRSFEALDLHRISGRADARNEASCQLMGRLGMRREAHLREDELFKGEWTDTIVYAVLRHEWTP